MPGNTSSSFNPKLDCLKCVNESINNWPLLYDVGFPCDIVVIYIFIQQFKGQHSLFRADVEMNTCVFLSVFSLSCYNLQNIESFTDMYSIHVLRIHFHVSPVVNVFLIHAVSRTT